MTSLYLMLIFNRQRRTGSSKLRVWRTGVGLLPLAFEVRAGHQFADQAERDELHAEQLQQSGSQVQKGVARHQHRGSRPRSTLAYFISTVIKQADHAEPHGN